jgi:hypothetical protein
MVIAGSRLLPVFGLAAVLLASPARGAELWVPVVAQMPGADGSYWNTELWLANLSAGAGTCAITFLPSGADNTEQLLSEPVPVTLGAGQVVYLKDVVPPRSSGALRLVTSRGVVVRCRLYNAQGRGSVGQMVPALAAQDLIPADARGHLFPLLRSPQFRTNVGLFNPGRTPIRVHAVLVDPEGQTVGQADFPLAPGSQTQVNDFLLAFKVSRSEGHAAVLSAEGLFAAYASIVDSRTGAPTLVLPEVE